MIKGTYTMEQGSTSFNKCDGSDVKVKAFFVRQSVQHPINNTPGHYYLPSK
jgi:5-hydroxyisourate hydrolase-like protein (transthyretin family)